MSGSETTVSIVDQSGVPPGDDDAAIDEASGAGTAGKALIVLECLTASPGPMTVADIIRHTGLSKPTAHRIITLLGQLGFVERSPGSRGFVEGARMVSLALNTLSASIARPFRHGILEALSQTVGETCNFGILQGSHVLYLDRVEAKWPLGLRFEAGSHVPAHCTAMGKLLLSRLSPEALRVTLATMTLNRYTENTITDVATLERELGVIRQSGVGTDNQEFLDGVVCVAVPVTGPDASTIGAIAISAPEARMSLDGMTGFLPEMRAAAERLHQTYA